MIDEDRLAAKSIWRASVRMGGLQIPYNHPCLKRQLAFVPTELGIRPATVSEPTLGRANTRRRRFLNLWSMGGLL
jgi:hypothetical protein